MDYFGDMQSSVKRDNNISANSSLFTPETIKDYIQRAYIKCYRHFRWPALADAVEFSTEAGQEYYDAPSNWSPHSLWRLEIDGKRWGEQPDGNPLMFSDYLNWKLDCPNSVEKKWSIQWLRYFVFPIPTTDGDINGSLWGQKNADPLVNDDDPTIFSFTMPECNEAIVLETQAMLKNKGNETSPLSVRWISGPLLFSLEAKSMLETAFSKIRQEQGKLEKNKPMFDVPNLFPARGPGRQNRM